MAGGKRINVSLTPSRLRRLDVMAERNGMKRSDFIKMVLDDKWLRYTKTGFIFTKEEEDDELE